MALKRPLPALMGGVSLSVLVSLGALAHQHLRTDALEERLLREVNTLTHAEHPRPAHVTATRPGTFGEAVTGLLPALLQQAREAPVPNAAEAATLEAVTEGRTPVTALPASSREALEHGRPLMLRVLAATHAESGGLPEDLRPLSAPETTRRDALLQALRHVVDAAALETRLLIARGDVDQAVDTCVDTLALNRELALGGGLLGQRLSANGYARTWRVCADALDAASLPRKRRAISQLTRLHEGFPPVSLTLHEESVAAQLHAFRDLLSDDARAALPPTWFDAPALPGALSRRLQWRQWVEDADRLIAVADQPAEERRRSLEAVEARKAGEYFRQPEAPSVRLSPEDVGALDLRALRSEALIALVEVDVARAEKGQWPRALPTRTASLVLKPVDETQAHIRSCVQGLMPDPLVVKADGPRALQQVHDVP
ncbi:hypothetical protein [Corallococcus aberystwythensis]|uniref:Secreted protein n=1 Tax=Corallococcus aberystwythensis TaxID=2316722 RepID=A0A3A8Q7G4_9BACT|nr:hypothetical protein [Corallococcus aberystwythensis]RKH64596.1 hypothetical protein D7W81_18275 [Corallococcus aberystwythensis]